jgi:DNA-binding NarL/FixJ family response regulator
MELKASKSDPGIPRKNRILLVEDHPIFRQGMIQLINHESDLEVCGEAETAAAALAAIDELKPDLVLVDITLKGTNGIELIKNIKGRFPALPTMVLSMHEESLYAERAMRAGARGYVMKQEAASEVMFAIRTVLGGGHYLSPTMNVSMIRKFVGGPDADTTSLVASLTDRELEILHLIGKGLRSREIAEEITLSIKTVETHRGNLKEKLGLRSATELLRFAVEWFGRAV